MNVALSNGDVVCSRCGDLKLARVFAGKLYNLGESVINIAFIVSGDPSHENLVIDFALLCPTTVLFVLVFPVLDLALAVTVKVSFAGGALFCLCKFCAA